MKKALRFLRAGLTILFLCGAFSFDVHAADTLRVLFIGNSYTSVNSLPQMFRQIAASTGQAAITDESTPGGYTFKQHTLNPTSLNKIAAGNWDYVVFQEQSQLPSFPDEQIATEMVPYAHFLDSFAKATNPCVQTVFYMTWGRKNGDAGNCPVWPPVCTYQGMDSLLRKRYIEMAEANHAVLTPAGAVWRYIRTHLPDIVLYTSDESHPSAAGTYAAGCAFYTVLLRQDPTLITYDAPGVSTAQAAQIRAAAKAVAFDSLDAWVSFSDPHAFFTAAETADGIVFTNHSQLATDYHWHFGDGATDTAAAPTHLYDLPGTYEVMLVAGRCGLTDTAWQTVTQNNSTNVSSVTQKGTISWYQDGQTLWLSSARPLPAGTRVALYNLSGQKVRQGVWTRPAAQLSLDVSALPRGLYLAIVTQNGQQRALKLSLR